MVSRSAGGIECRHHKFLEYKMQDDVLEPEQVASGPNSGNGCETPK